MKKVSIGINDISVYVPEPTVDLDELTDRRVKDAPELERHFTRARETTGQRSFRFPALWEDTTTLGAEAAIGLLGRMDPRELASLRFLSVGTETPVDHSKPVAAYLQGILRQSGFAVPESIATFQVQHACAGGALAAVSVGALLAMSASRRESGLVICSDIARYKTESTAEITQGAGAAALHISGDPALLRLDLDTQGFNSRDVDDFFRPIGRVTASVRGGYSMKCYLESFEAALVDHCRRRGEDPGEVLSETDIFVLHAPFRNMPVLAMQRILSTHLGVTAGECEEFLAARGFAAAIDPVARIGNTYTASLFISLAFALEERYRLLGERITGKRVLMVSYGSGNTMAVISGRVAPGAARVISSWDLGSIWKRARKSEESEYDEWIARPMDNDHYQQVLATKCIPENAVYLGSIRDDGYRVYGVKRATPAESRPGKAVLSLA